MSSPQNDLSNWPTEAQVAAQLGISDRTLRREVVAGKWQTAQRKRPGGGRPETVYDPEAVAQRMPRPRTTVVRNSPEPDTDMMAGLSDPLAELGNPLAGLTETTMAILPALMDLIEDRAARMQPKQDPTYVPLERASEITGLTEGFLKRLVKAKRIEGVADVGLKLRRDALEEMQVNDLPPAPKRSRGKRKKR